MHRLLLTTTILMTLGAAACGSEVNPGPGSGGSGGAGTTTTSTSSGQGGQGGVGSACATDADCTPGEAWCEGGACVACDNGGLACDIACIQGWTTYERNGCFPCACAPMNACVDDAGCGGQQKCYAGKFCWDWCPPGDPSCCYGNTCSQPGCADPNPAGCYTTGCPMGQDCTDVPNECASSGCACDGAIWACTPDCGGGTCVTPL